MVSKRQLLSAFALFIPLAATLSGTHAAALATSTTATAPAGRDIAIFESGQVRPLGSGRRIGVDRDRDGILDRDER